MREMLKMILVLSLICTGSGWLLSSVRKATAPIIEEQVMTYVQGPALASIFPGIDDAAIKNRQTFATPDGGKITIFPVTQNGRLDSVAFETFGNGYGGPVGVMVGIDIQDNDLAGIGLTTHKETPGLGARATQPEFTGQFTGHPFSGVALKNKGGDIDAISGATITSTGVTSAVAKAATTFEAIKPKILAGFEKGTTQGAGQ